MDPLFLNAIDTAYELSEVVIVRFGASKATSEEDHVLARTFQGVHLEFEETACLLAVPAIKEALKSNPQKLFWMQGVVSRTKAALADIGRNIGRLRHREQPLRNLDTIENMRSNLASCHASLTTVLNFLHQTEVALSPVPPAASTPPPTYEAALLCESEGEGGSGTGKKKRPRPPLEYHNTQISGMGVNKSHQSSIGQAKSDRNAPVSRGIQEKNPADNLNGPLMLQEFISEHNPRLLAGFLQDNFEEVAKAQFDWLHELLDIGCTYEEMAQLLVDGDSENPWVMLDSRLVDQLFKMPRPSYSSEYHQENCVHQGGRKVDTEPKIIAQARHVEEAPQTPISRIKQDIGRLCGLAGVLPLKEGGRKWDNWASCVKFGGEDNSIALVGYTESGFSSIPGGLSRRISDALERDLLALASLQQCGLICNGFTVLRFTVSKSMSSTKTDPQSWPCIELCHIEIASIENLWACLQALDGVYSTDRDRLHACSLAARYFLCIARHWESEPNPDLEHALWECALATQIISLGILSYTQAHTSCLHPEFLVGPLREVHLLGTSNPLDPTSEYVVASLLDFTCMKEAVCDSVLVFRANSTPNSQTMRSFNPSACYDLLASPKGLAVTWRPARFVTTPRCTTELYAIEIGGGTITVVGPSSFAAARAHWCIGYRGPGQSPVALHPETLILIAGVSVNKMCPLDEARSWQHPTTNAWLRHLGTSPSHWELREKQAGIQGGQYTTLAFNPTFIKQDGFTLKQQQLSLPFNEIDLAFLDSTCGLQISFCTGVARRVPLRVLLADVMVAFVESKLSKPSGWEELKSQHSIVQNFRFGLEPWFDGLPSELKETVICIVRSMLEVLKDTGIDKNGEELVIAWVRKESPYTCLRLLCEKTSLWARILADSEDCATFACITSLCLERLGRLREKQISDAMTKQVVILTEI